MGRILRDWGTFFPASKQWLLLTVPQKDRYEMVIPQETQKRHLGAKFVVVLGTRGLQGKTRSHHLRCSAPRQSQDEALLPLHHFSCILTSHLTGSHPTPSVP